jgi:hypothetical protein
MRRPLVLAAAIAAVAAFAGPAFAAGTVIDVPEKFESVLPKVKEKSGIAVRIPSFFDASIKPSRVFGKGSARKGKYRLDLGVSRQCNGGNACFVGAFYGERGGDVDNSMRVSLARGITGFWAQGGCGANCAPDSLQWKQGKVLYDIQVKASTAKMIRMANQAIKAGPR